MNNVDIWAISLYVIGVIALCSLMLGVAYFAGGRSKARYKNTPFESGVVPVGNSHLRFSARFYLVAMLFVIFDVEALYLMSWSVSVRENGWNGFIEAFIFIAILLVGLFYLVRIGALDWTPKRSRRELLSANRVSEANKK